MTSEPSSPPPLHATYRLQLREGMTFRRAADLVPHLARLGTSHLYLSPIFEAAPGSTHGYDVTDPTRLDAGLGGEAGFAELHHALSQHGLGLIVDFVPNHMAAHPANPWFRDVLAWGRESAFAAHFDVDWTQPKILLAMLPKSYGDALAGSNLSIALSDDGTGFAMRHGGLALPLHPRSTSAILARIAMADARRLARRLAAAHPDESEALGRDLAALAADPAAGSALANTLERMNRDPSALHALHEAQPWRLAHWRAGREMLTYRRFFEISDLIGLTIERRQTFDDVHRRLLDLIRDRMIDGVRLDHIDGLADPSGYLDRLDAAIITARREPLPLFVEKIVEPGEKLPAQWPIAGTTGYEFIANLAGLLVDPGGAVPLTEAYERFTGEPFAYARRMREARRQILETNLASEVRWLTTILSKIAANDLAARDFGPDTLRRAILDLAAGMDVYRTYIATAGPSRADRAVLARAFRHARATTDLEDQTVFDFLERILTLAGDSPAAEAAALDFISRFQQTTGPVMAKAVEDTAFYRINRLIALNEVGGSADVFGASPDGFHGAMAERLATAPLGQSATATHDTKRGEDARARLYAISEMADTWAAAVDRWSAMNLALKTTLGRHPAPDPNTEWLFYQALLGVWPPYLSPAGTPEDWSAVADRMAAFMLKAVREAKRFTSWTATNKRYEHAVDRFTRDALDPARSTAFLNDFHATCAPLLGAGVTNALTQVLLKVTAPGTPDIYQGTERWDLSLVDPDNRRPPDWSAITEPPLRLAPEELGVALTSWHDGRIKAHVLAAALDCRRRTPDLYSRGDYIPLDVDGPDRAHVLAFARRDRASAAIVVVPRLVLARPQPAPDATIRLPAGWEDRTWRDALTGRTLGPAAELGGDSLLDPLPLALLVPNDTAGR